MFRGTEIILKLKIRAFLLLNLFMSFLGQQASILTIFKALLPWTYIVLVQIGLWIRLDRDGIAMIFPWGWGGEGSWQKENKDKFIGMLVLYLCWIHLGYMWFAFLELAFSRENLCDICFMVLPRVSHVRIPAWLTCKHGLSGRGGWGDFWTLGEKDLQV